MRFRKHVLERVGICNVVQVKHLHLMLAFVPWSQASFSSPVYPANVLSNVVCLILLFNHRRLCHCAKRYTFLAAFLMQELKGVFSLHVSVMKE